MKKLDELSAALGSEYNYSENFRSFDFQNTVSVLTVLNQLEKLPVDELKRLATGA